MAVGQAPDFSFLGDEFRIVVDRGLVQVKKETLETGWEGIYSGGDVAKMPGSLIHAVKAGRKAAESIDLALGGRGEISESLFETDIPDPAIGRDEGFSALPRERSRSLNLKRGLRDLMRLAGFQ